MSVEKKLIKIRLMSRDYHLLDESVLNIANAAKYTGVEVKGPIPLPVRIERFTVLRSPHIHKKSREQFEYRLHARMLEVVAPSAETMKSLMGLSLPSGVHVKINVKN